jgi:hypothetical protein
MKKIDKKIKSLSIEFDRNTRLDEVDEVVEDFKKVTDEKFEVDASIDIIKSTLYLKRVRKPYIKLATDKGKKV